MRGLQERTGPLFSYISTEDRILVSHPLRQVRRLADQALDRLNPSFCRLCPEGGRPSIPPEQLLLAAPEVKPLLSSEHFSLECTLVRAWASHSSLERIDGLDDEPPLPSGGQGFMGWKCRQKAGQR